MLVRTLPDLVLHAARMRRYHVEAPVCRLITPMKPIIDIDDTTTWPPHIHRIVSMWAAECAGKTSYTNDLPLRIELEAPFREQLTAISFPPTTTHGYCLMSER